VWRLVQGLATLTTPDGNTITVPGFGHGSGAHAPNEYMVIAPKEGSRIFGLAAIEKGYVDLLYALASR
jgi:hypothetical protein